MHGFDEFFGNLYHLNAEEEPEDPDYPKDPEFKKRFGPRGVLHCWADGKGGQKIEDTGPLTKKRMETIDDEVTEHALRFIDEAHKAGTSRSSCGTTPRACTSAPTAAEKHKGKRRPGRIQRRDGRARRAHRPDAQQARRARHRRRHDRHVLDRQRPALQFLAGRRHHAVPLGEEHQLGGRLARAGVRALAGQDQGRARCSTTSSATRTGCRRCWPPPASRTSRRSCSSGHTAGDKTFKVHLDGFNMLPYLTGEAKESPRNFFFYISDDGDILAIRMGDWKVVLMEQRAKHARVLVRAVRAAPGAEDVQSAARPVRAGRRELEHLLGLAALPRLHHLCDAGGRRQADRTPSRNSRRARSPPRSTSTRSCDSCRKRTAAPITNRPNPERSPASRLRCARRADFGHAGALVRGSP